MEQPKDQDSAEAARKLGKTALLEFRAQKPGTNETFSKIRRLKNQLDKIIVYREDSNLKKLEVLDSTDINAQLNNLALELGLSKVDLDQDELIAKVREKFNYQILKLFEASYLTGTD